MDNRFAKIEIYNKDETSLLKTLEVPISLMNESYMLYAINTSNVVKVFDSENQLRINSKLFNSFS
jgi:hypothetical protein